MPSLTKVYTQVDGIETPVFRALVEDPTQVFAYGLLLKEDLGAVAATLPGYRLAFTSFATPVPDEDGTIYGAVIQVDDDWLQFYDRIEGYQVEKPEAGYYRREVVETSAGHAWVYIMNEQFIAPGFPPTLHYVDGIRQAYDWLLHPIRAYEALEAAVEEAYDGATV